MDTAIYGPKCVCGHAPLEHELLTKKCHNCACSTYRQALPFTVRTILSDQGIARVSIEYGATALQLVPDAAIQIGLELISAAYAASSEMGLFKYAKEHGLVVEELLKLVRED